MPKVKPLTENTNWLKANILSQMAYNDISIEQLSKRCNISVSTMRNRFARPYELNIGELFSMAKAFGCEPELLLNKEFKRRMIPYDKRNNL